MAAFNSDFKRLPCLLVCYRPLARAFSNTLSGLTGEKTSVFTCPRDR